ncbi:MAG: hypothetical protein ABFD98_07165 [Syntrophobacteraceae bacterium]|nr:hypothetical protein [Desulfobacteraceae bacterium]
MAGRMPLEEFLASVEQTLRSGGWPAREELRALLDLCAHPEERIRETATALLLAPPAADEPAHFARLLHFLASRPVGMDRLPRAFAEFLREALSFLLEMPSDPTLRALFARALKRLGKESLLASRSLPLAAAVQSLGADAFVDARGAASPAALKRRWRLFRKRLLSAPPSPPWAEPTTADLEPLRWNVGKSRRLPFRRARWLATLRPLFFRPAPPSHPSAFAHLHWNGLGPSALGFLEALVRQQAEELRAVRELAVGVSRATRRVVLSWHNATLAAVGGWAFEHLEAFFPPGPLFEEFCRAVKHRADAIERDMQSGGSGANRLARLREERLFAPKLAHALWESRIRAAMDAGRRDGFERDLRAARPFLAPDVLAEIEGGAKYCWHGAVSPHQRISVRGVLSEMEAGRSGFGKGLALLAALAVEGGRLLEAGRVEHFVLPWIDKFFISSLRGADRDYLPALVRRLEDSGVRPLVLFWEDTAHSRAPSFQIALEQMAERGYLFRGIGIFGGGRERRDEAAAVILEEHGRRSLFALRPWGDGHNYRSLHQLLRTLDRGFFKAYDSSWKDNLCFLYSGTQIVPLLSIQCEPEPFAAWSAENAARFPFGAALRSFLRREVLGAAHLPADPLSLRYALWANLT